jgi:hypothetical protein
VSLTGDIISGKKIYYFPFDSYSHEEKVEFFVIRMFGLVTPPVEVFMSVENSSLQATVRRGIVKRTFLAKERGKVTIPGWGVSTTVTLTHKGAKKFVADLKCPPKPTQALVDGMRDYWESLSK